MVYVQNPLACTSPSTWTTSPPAATFPYYHNKTSPKQGTPPDTQRDRFREEQTRRPRQQERTRVHPLACTDFTTGITTKSPSLTQVSHTTGTPPHPVHATPDHRTSSTPLHGQQFRQATNDHKTERRAEPTTHPPQCPSTPNRAPTPMDPPPAEQNKPQEAPTGHKHTAHPH